MQHKKVFFIIFIVIHLGFWVLFYLLNFLTFKSFLSFEVANFSFLLIVFSSFLHYKKGILIQSKNYKFVKKPLMIFTHKIQNPSKIINYKVFNDDLKPKFKEKIQNFSLYFGLLKLLSYGILVAGFLALNKQNLLCIWAYIAGISALVLCVLIFAVFLKYES